MTKTQYNLKHFIIILISLFAFVGVSVAHEKYSTNSDSRPDRHHLEYKDRRTEYCPGYEQYTYFFDRDTPQDDKYISSPTQEEMFQAIEKDGCEVAHVSTFDTGFDNHMQVVPVSGSALACCPGGN